MPGLHSQSGSYHSSDIQPNNPRMSNSGRIRQVVAVHNLPDDFHYDPVAVCVEHFVAVGARHPYLLNELATKSGALGIDGNLDARFFYPFSPYFFNLYRSIRSLIPS